MCSANASAPDCQSPPLRDLLSFTRDGEWGKGEPTENHGPALVIRGTDFETVRHGDLSSLPIRYIRCDVLDRKHLQPSDVLLETAGGSKGRPTGRSLFLKESILERAGLPIVCASFSRFLRPDKSRIEPEYLFWWLQYLYETGEMDRHQVQHTGVARFQYTRFAESIHPPLPARDTQRRIAHILGTLDAKIELNRRMNRTLEAIARTIFKSWFVDFDPVIDNALAVGKPIPEEFAERTAHRAQLTHEESSPPVNIRRLFPDEFQDSELGPIPKGWEVRTLGDVAEHPRRSVQVDQIDPETPYIALEHMPKQCIALSDWGTADGLQSNKFEFRQGEILFGKLRPYFHKVGIAPVDGVCSTDIVVVKPRQDAWFGFVLGHVSSTSFVDYTTAGSTGTKMPRTNWKEMARYPVVIPPVHLAEAFSEQVKVTVDRIIATIHESRTLAALRDALLPKLIRGEIWVKEPLRLLQKSLMHEEVNRCSE